jgi:selenocysteine lyase/cysteine desulfurase
MGCPAVGRLKDIMLSMTTLNWNRAATSADPYPGVEQAMIEGLHALPHDRGPDGSTTAERIYAIRARAARMFGFPNPERVLFTPGATYGLNLAVQCGIADGSRVLTTAYEHNAMTRPLHAARDRGVRMDILPFDASGMLRLDALESALAEGDVDWLALGVASNTLGTIQPFAEACAMARAAGAKVILDMAQGGGQVPIDLQALDASYASIAGHKSLHGPRGIGMLFVAPGEDPPSFLHGGTGTEGTMFEMPAHYPEHLETGTSNYPGIFGLGAALAWLEKHPDDLAPIRGHLAKFEAWCLAHPALEVLPTKAPSWDRRLPVLALKPIGIPPTVLVDVLAGQGLLVRSGSMCTTGVLPSFSAEEGLVRLSPPTDADAAEFAHARELFEQALQVLA